MVVLYWPRQSTFVDAATDGPVTRYGQGIHDIPDDRADHYRERGWIGPNESDIDIEAARDSDNEDTAGAVEGDQQQEQNQNLDENELTLSADDTQRGAEAQEADTEVGPGGGNGAEATDTDTDEFDAEAFVDRNASEVREDIRSGDYDAHLDAIEDAELADRDRTTVHDELEQRREGGKSV